MGKPHVPQYRGGKPRPKSHSGRRNGKIKVKKRRPDLEVSDDVKVKREMVNQIQREPRDEPTGIAKMNTGSPCDEQSLKVRTETRGTQCDIMSEEVKRLQSENAQLNAEKTHLVRNTMKLQDQLDWVRGLRRDGVDQQSIGNMLGEAA